MHWRYAKASSLPQVIRDLLRIYRQLLVVLDGNVEQALELLEEIGDRYGLWRDEFGMEQFRELIQRRGEVAVRGDGTLKLSPRGERALRKQALYDIFQGHVAAILRRPPHSPRRWRRRGPRGDAPVRVRGYA